ncbi:hypothetical protein QBC39DRAFT_343971 [Podospora conica]|nr:hypothetical protein QBC39DRAFT_343971 [Schizothecium conicum]
MWCLTLSSELYEGLWTEGHKPGISGLRLSSRCWLLLASLDKLESSSLVNNGHEPHRSSLQEPPIVHRHRPACRRRLSPWRWHDRVVGGPAIASRTPKAYFQVGEEWPILELRQVDAPDIENRPWGELGSPTVAIHDARGRREPGLVYIAQRSTRRERLIAGQSSEAETGRRDSFLGRRGFGSGRVAGLGLVRLDGCRRR